MAFRRTGGRLPDVRSESSNHEQLRGQGNASPDSSRGILHGNHERTVAIIADAAEAQHNHENDKCSLGQDSGPRTTEIGTSRPRDLRRGRGRLRNRITACWRTRPSGLAATHGLRHLGLARARRDAPRASRERWAGLLNSGRGRGGPSPLPRWSRSAAVVRRGSDPGWTGSQIPSRWWTAVHPRILINRQIGLVRPRLAIKLHKE